MRMLGGLALAALIATTATAQPRLPGNFVALRDVDPSIRQDMRYASADNFTGRALPGYDARECLLKRPVAEALKRVQAGLMTRGLTLKVYDCYRPKRAIAAMAQWARDPRATPDTSRFYPALDKAKLFALGYISGHSAHSRGVAIDLTLVARDATPAAPYDPNSRYGSCAGPALARAPDDALDMGTAFDCFDTKSATRNPTIAPEAKANRELLVDAMRRQGFANYKREWWHFSFASADDGVTYDFPIPRR